MVHLFGIGIVYVRLKAISDFNYKENTLSDQFIVGFVASMGFVDIKETYSLISPE